MKLKTGFTLIELLVAMTLLAIIAAGVIVAINPQKWINRAKDTKTLYDIGQLAIALQAYYTTNRIYPEQLSDLVISGDLKIEPKSHLETSYNYFRSDICNTKSCEAQIFFALADPQVPGNVWCWSSETGKASEVAADSCGEAFPIPPGPPLVVIDEEPSPGDDSGKYAIHSFIFANYPTSVKDYLFDQAAKTGKTLIRFDFSLSVIEPTKGNFQWTKMDENVTRASARGLSIVGTLGYSASWISAPGARDPNHGPIETSKISDYKEYVKTVVQKYPQVEYWEAWNEPNALCLYHDTDSSSACGEPVGGAAESYGSVQFAQVLKATYDGVKEASPNAQVLFPGVIFGSGVNRNWVQSVLNELGAQYPGQNSYDIANVHIRGSLSTITTLVANAKDIFNATPLWITEHGYPSDQSYQNDPKYNYGEQAQADYYKESLPLLTSLGADKVFVTLRDYGDWESACNPPNKFCYEGLVTLTANESLRKDRPSMEVFQSF